MAENSPRKRKSVVATVAVALVALVAAYMGVDLGENSATSSSSTSSSAAAPSSAQTDSDLPVCGSLPAEAEDTAADIEAGGPYDYPDNDNQHFGNYEGILPDENSDYYREYTVETPGLNHRGARRIVTGGGTETNPEVWYYTDDHYESFCEIPE